MTQLSTLLATCNANVFPLCCDLICTCDNIYIVLLMLHNMLSLALCLVCYLCFPHAYFTCVVFRILLVFVLIFSCYVLTLHCTCGHCFTYVTYVCHLRHIWTVTCVSLILTLLVLDFVWYLYLS